MNETMKTRNQGGFRKISDLINATKSKQVFSEFEMNVTGKLSSKPAIRNLEIA